VCRQPWWNVVYAGVSRKAAGKRRYRLKGRKYRVIEIYFRGYGVARGVRQVFSQRGTAYVQKAASRNASRGVFGTG